MNPTNEQNSEHDNQKKLIGHRPRPAARPVDDAGHDLYAEPETLSPGPDGTGPATEDGTIGEGTQPAPLIIRRCHNSDMDRLTEYKPTARECKMLAARWVEEMVLIEDQIEFGYSGGSDLRRRHYIACRLVQLIDLEICTEGELNHMLYVERKKRGLNHDDRDAFGHGTIEHPKEWLKELELMKRRKEDGLGVPSKWEPFVQDADGDANTENGPPSNICRLQAESVSCEGRFYEDEERCEDEGWYDNEERLEDEGLFEDEARDEDAEELQKHQQAVSAGLKEGEVALRVEAANVTHSKGVATMQEQKDIGVNATPIEEATGAKRESFDIEFLDDGFSVHFETAEGKIAGVEANCDEVEGYLPCKLSEFVGKTESEVVQLLDRASTGIFSPHIRRAAEPRRVFIDGISYPFTKSKNIRVIHSSKSYLIDKEAKNSFVRGPNEENIHGTLNEAMILVEGGTFQMGHPGYEVFGQPVHAVTVSSFWLDAKEVTVAQYRLFCRATGGSMPVAPSWGWSDDNPIVGVSWVDATFYCRWAGKRLQTEAEWEFAARGGNQSQGYIYSGGNSLDSVAWYNRNSGDRPHAVGTKTPNELGLYDMSGNAWEWCSDWYNADYYQESPSLNPKGPTNRGTRVLRGGSWYGAASHCRADFRYGSSPSDSSLTNGFRCAKDDQ